MCSHLTRVAIIGAPCFPSGKQATRNRMRTTSVGVFRIATKGPGDVSGLMGLIASGKIDPKSILAILGKTEGNGGVNDFTREYATVALVGALAPSLGISAEAGE